MIPLWGLVSHEAAANYPSDRLKTVQKLSLFLTRLTSLSRSSGVVTQSRQNLPGVEVPDAGLGAVASMTYSTQGLADYTGEGNLGMAQQWSKLSESAEFMTKALNLVWTDYAANAVFGTNRSLSPGTTMLRPVSTRHPAIRYNLGYAVPAIVVFAILLLTSFLVVVALLLGRATVSKMRRYLHATSAGKLMASASVLPRTLTAARQVDNYTLTSEWLESVGRINVVAGKSTPLS